MNIRIACLDVYLLTSYILSNIVVWPRCDKNSKCRSCPIEREKFLHEKVFFSYSDLENSSSASTIRYTAENESNNSDKNVVYSIRVADFLEQFSLNLLTRPTVDKSWVASCRIIAGINRRTVCSV